MPAFSSRFLEERVSFETRWARNPATGLPLSCWKNGNSTKGTGLAHLPLLHRKKHLAPPLGALGHTGSCLAGLPLSRTPVDMDTPDTVPPSVWWGQQAHQR